MAPPTFPFWYWSCSILFRKVEACPSPFSVFTAHSPWLGTSVSKVVGKVLADGWMTIWDIGYWHCGPLGKQLWPNREKPYHQQHHWCPHRYYIIFRLVCPRHVSVSSYLSFPELPQIDLHGCEMATHSLPLACAFSFSTRCWVGILVISRHIAHST